MNPDKMVVNSPKDNRKSAKRSKIDLERIEGAAKTFYGLVQESITNL